jgi:predicted esterase
MPSWFDMQGFSLSVLLDEKLDPCHGIVESAKHVQQILRDEIKLIDSTKVFVGGFSQGACVARNFLLFCSFSFFPVFFPVHAGLSFDLPLGGIVSCSGWAAAFSLVQVNDANKNTRIQLFHGKHDNVIPLKCSDALVSKLESMGLKYERSLSLHEHGFDDFKAVTEFICGKLN